MVVQAEVGGQRERDSRRQQGAEERETEVRGMHGLRVAGGVVCGRGVGIVGFLGWRLEPGEGGRVVADVGEVVGL